MVSSSKVFQYYTWYKIAWCFTPYISTKHIKKMHKSAPSISVLFAKNSFYKVETKQMLYHNVEISIIMHYTNEALFRFLNKANLHENATSLLFLQHTSPTPLWLVRMQSTDILNLPFGISSFLLLNSTSFKKNEVIVDDM